MRYQHRAEISPLGWGAAINYDDDVWYHPYRGPLPANPPLDTDTYLIGHYGGLANSAGVWPFNIRAEEAKLRQWEDFHCQPKPHGRGWRGIAYCYAIGQSGRLYRLRGPRTNAGQYGSEWNRHTISVVWLGGKTQRPSRRARRTFARLWVEHPATVLGHRDTYGTECPGSYWGQWIDDERYRTELGLLKWGARGPSVRALTARLHDLGFIDRTYGLFRRQVVAAVKEFQGYAEIEVDGIVGPLTFTALAGEGDA